MLKVAVFIGLLSATPLILFGQSPPQKRLCGTEDHYTEMYKTDASFRAFRQNLLKLTNAYAMVLSSTRIAPRTTPFVIPVVVHVVWHDNVQNISDAQIQSQIDVLNRDFMRVNTDISGVPSVFQASIGNPRIQFRLAVRDPQGKATSGITRTQTQRTSFTYTGTEKDFVKFSDPTRGGSDAWPSDQYLNVWICQLAGSVLGYSTFPGAPKNIDGVVITYTAFGTNGTASPPFNLGRTLTHELGHWLNLFHIWGDDKGACTGSDQVDDTPNQGDANGGCPAFPHVSCQNGPNGDMFMNYMDYTNDSCMFMFTAGQVARMEATMGSDRLSLTVSNALTPP